jgi:hypothetical protein
MGIPESWADVSHVSSFFSFGQQRFGLDKQCSALYLIISFYFYFQLRLAGQDKQ